MTFEIEQLQYQISKAYDRVLEALEMLEDGDTGAIREELDEALQHLTRAIEWEEGCDDDDE